MRMLITEAVNTHPPQVLRCWVALIVALSFAPTVHAQQVPVPEKMLGTTYVVSEPTYGSGVLLGCGLSYKALIRDWKYRQGEPSVVFGSFGAMKANQGSALGGFLKLVVQDLSVRGNDIANTPNAPAFAYLLSSGALSTAGDRVGGGASDQPGGLFTVFRLDGNFLEVIGQAVGSQKVKVMFRRQGGSLDVPIDLDLSVVETSDQLERKRDTRELVEFGKCLPLLAR
jgi:hypothetical protein